MVSGDQGGSLLHPVSERQRLEEEQGHFACQQLYLTLMLATGFWCIWPWDSLREMKPAWKRWDPPDQAQKKYLWQQGGQSDRELQTRMRGVERGSPKQGEKVVDKQRTWGKWRELVIKITGLKGVYHRGTHIKKEDPTRESCGESFHTLFGKAACGASALKCSYTDTCHVLNVGTFECWINTCQENWGFYCVLAELCWDWDHGKMVIYLTDSALSEYRLFRKDKVGRQGGRDVRESKALTGDR